MSSAAMEESVRVTHKDIAARFGCDKSTVSLALRGNPRIPEETRRQICELAEQMGYRPDPALALLARHRWARHEAGGGATLAYLVDRSNGEAYDQQRRQFAWAKERAQQRGYNLIEFDLSAYPTSTAASNVLYHRGIPGLILPHMPHGAEVRLSGSEWNRFTVVCSALGWARAPFHVVGPDIFEGTRRLWQETVKRGYRRIGAAMFRHNPVAIDDYTRLGASMVEQAELVPEALRIPILQSDPLDKAAFMTWFEKYRPEVVIGFINRVHEWLTDEGYRVPEDVAFACLNVWPGDPHAGLSVQSAQVARAAVDFLIAQMHENQWGVPSVQECLLLESHWVDGPTLPTKRSTVVSLNG